MRQLVTTIGRRISLGVTFQRLTTKTSFHFSKTPHLLKHKQYFFVQKKKMNKLFFLLFLSFLSLKLSKFIQRSDHLNFFNSSFPIIVVGLPKSGTTSITDFLRLYGIKSAHQFISLKYCLNIYPIPSIQINDYIIWKTIKKPTHKCFIGELIHLAIIQKKDPLFYLFSNNLYSITQMDSCYEVNYWPQIDAINLKKRREFPQKFMQLIILFLPILMHTLYIHIVQILLHMYKVFYIGLIY